MMKLIFLCLGVFFQFILCPSLAHSMARVYVYWQEPSAGGNQIEWVGRVPVSKTTLNTDTPIKVQWLRRNGVQGRYPSSSISLGNLSLEVQKLGRITVNQEIHELNRMEGHKTGIAKRLFANGIVEVIWKRKGGLPYQGPREYLSVSSSHSVLSGSIETLHGISVGQRFLAVGDIQYKITGIFKNGILEAAGENPLSRMLAEKMEYINSSTDLKNIESTLEVSSLLGFQVGQLVYIKYKPQLTDNLYFVQGRVLSLYKHKRAAIQWEKISAAVESPNLINWSSFSTGDDRPSPYIDLILLAKNPESLLPQ